MKKLSQSGGNIVFLNILKIMIFLLLTEINQIQRLLTHKFETFLWNPGWGSSWDKGDSVFFLLHTYVLLSTYGNWLKIPYVLFSKKYMCKLIPNLGDLTIFDTKIKGKIKRERAKTPKFLRLRRAKGSLQQFNWIFVCKK